MSAYADRFEIDFSCSAWGDYFYTGKIKWEIKQDDAILVSTQQRTLVGVGVGVDVGVDVDAHVVVNFCCQRQTFLKVRSSVGRLRAKDERVRR